MKNKKITSSSKNESIGLAERSVRNRPLYTVILVLWSIYLFFTLQAPDGANLLHLSPQALDLIRMTIALPYLLIWLCAAYAYTRIKRYAVAITPSPESDAFHNIATGVLILLCSLILSTVMSTMRTYFGDTSDLRPLLTILTNYMYILPYLIAFSFFFKGTLKLIHQIRNFKFPVKKYVVYGIPFTVFVYIWLEFIFTNQTRVVSLAKDIYPTYYLKDSLLILTIIIPALITWLLGTLAALRLRMYHQLVKGTIYKQALASLVYGFSGIILASIVLQALLSLGTQRLLDLGLDMLLGLIYLFLLIQALGFIFIARGAKRLSKIESV